MVNRVVTAKPKVKVKVEVEGKTEILIRTILVFKVSALCNKMMVDDLQVKGCSSRRSQIWRIKRTSPPRRGGRVCELGLFEGWVKRVPTDGSSNPFLK
jgi:hypothetical protein